jgi:hypothetical protein
VWQPRVIFDRFRIRSAEKARSHVEGTLHRARVQGVIPLRVLDIRRSERRGSCALVADEDGRTFEAWFWWYQAVRDELVICREASGDASDGTVDDAVEFGNEKQRGVIDRVPRDVMQRYLRSDTPPRD